MSRYLQGFRYQQIPHSRSRIIACILGAHHISLEQLPVSTREALQHSEAEIRWAARLAFAAGCLIDDFSVAGTQCSFNLRCPASLTPVRIDTQKTACETATWGQLQKRGLKPPSRQLVEALFAEITL